MLRETERRFYGQLPHGRDNIGVTVMNLKRHSFVIMALIFSIAATSPAFAKSKPEVDSEGMELVKNSKLATVYADPGADLSIYDRIWLQDATVSFKKNWQRDQNQSYPLKVRNSDMVRIQEDVATLFMEVFTKELTENGYQMVEEAGPDVLLVVPAIVNLDVVAPDIPTSTNTRAYSTKAGEMTLNLELYDSLTNDKIAKATDRKRDYDRGYAEWRTSVNNTAVARRMMTTWAQALTSALNEARDSTKPSK
jgi:hypothetical protein